MGSNSTMRGTSAHTILAVVLTACLLAPISAAAQGVALAGTVTAAQKAAVPGAEIRLTREDGTVARSTVSESTGGYRLSPLAAGVFVLEVTKDGFRRHTQVVVIASSTEATLDIQLDVAGVNDSVVV